MVKQWYLYWVCFACACRKNWITSWLRVTGYHSYQLFTVDDGNKEFCWKGLLLVLLKGERKTKEEKDEGEEEVGLTKLPRYLTIFPNSHWFITDSGSINLCQEFGAVRSSKQECEDDEEEWCATSAVGFCATALHTRMPIVSSLWGRKTRFYSGVISRTIMACLFVSDDSLCSRRRYQSF